MTSNQPIITTRKGLAKSEYVVLANNRDTGLRISKGAPAKFGYPQEWDVCDVEGRCLFSAKGKASCVSIICIIAEKVNA